MIHQPSIPAFSLILTYQHISCQGDKSSNNVTIDRWKTINKRIMGTQQEPVLCQLLNIVILVIILFRDLIFWNFLCVGILINSISCHMSRWPKIYEDYFHFILWLGSSRPSQIAKFMRPSWGPPGSCRPQMGPMLAPWTLLSGMMRPMNLHSKFFILPACHNRVTFLGPSAQQLTLLAFVRNKALCQAPPPWCDIPINRGKMLI